MIFVVRFQDHPDKHHVRTELMRDHLEFLGGHADAVRLAGSLRREEDDSPIGAAWLVEAQDFDEVRRLYADDPFWIAGLRRSVEVHRLAKAFPDAPQLI